MYNWFDQSLEKVTSQVDVKVVLATGKLNSQNPLKKIPQVKEKFDALESKLFQERLNRIIEPQDKIDLENKLQKFEDFKEQQDSDRRAALAKEETRLMDQREERKKVELDKMRRAKNFNHNWAKSGDENWKKNMAIKLRRDKEEEKFKIGQNNRMETVAMNKKTQLHNEVYDELDDFEERHMEEKETDVDTVNGDMEEPDLRGSRRAQPDHMIHHEELHRMIQDREKEMHSEHFRKERDKRRRKMIVDQSKGQREIEIKRKENGLLEKMIQESRQEEEIRYEFYRTRKAKQLLVEDRSLRENMYDQRTRHVKAREEGREQNMLEHMINDFSFQVDIYLKREKTLRINKDIDKRDLNYARSRKIVETLLNISESCYSHNQDADSKNVEEIESRFWNENLSLLRAESEPFVYRNPRHSISTDVFTKDLHEEDKFKKYLDLELKQYLNAEGQWKVPVVSPKSHETPIDLKLDPLGEAGRVKIPKTPINNEYLGNLLARLIDLKHPKDTIENKVEYPQYLPIKLVLLGKFYSGKSTVTRYLQNKFNLEIISVDQIVSEAIVRFGNCEDSFDHPEEIAQYNFLQNGYASLMPPEEEADNYGKKLDELDILENKSVDQSEDDKDKLMMTPGRERINVLSPKSDSNSPAKKGTDSPHPEPEASLPRNPLKSLIRCLYRGEQPSDELLCRIVVDEIKKRHAYMPEEEFFRKLNSQREQLIREEKDRTIKLQEQTHEKVNIVRQKVDLAEKRKEIQVDESKFALVPPSGYVLLDFPNSYAQAKTLERIMSDFLPRNERPKSEAQAEKEFLITLVKPSVKKQLPTVLKQAGFDKVLYLEASNDACLNRAFGDYKTPRDMHYHLVANPPPINQTPLVEKLTFNEVPAKNQFLMADLNKNRSLDLPEMLDLYSNFGSEEDKVNCIVRVDANNDMTTLLSDIDDIVAKLLSKKNSYYASFAEKIAARQQAEEEKLKAESIFREKEAEMKLVEHSTLTDALVKTKERMSSDQLKPQVQELLLNLWSFSSKSYVRSSEKCFKEIRDSREVFAVVLAEHQRSFIQYIETDDEKKRWLYEYQKMYNDFIDEHPDILEQEMVKEEFHQRVDDLVAKLYQFAANKKTSLQEERKRVMEDGFVEREMKMLTKTLHGMLQAEIDRYLCFSHIIRGYYRGVEQKTIEEFNGPLPCAINYDVTYLNNRIYPILRSKKATITNTSDWRLSWRTVSK